ncbi:hypothetical protein PTKIN_Ptkin10aG0034200 [Pterospermum kingtungense]
MESMRRFESGVNTAHHVGPVSKANIHFTNFPIGWSAENLCNIFKKYGEILDVHIPAKKNVWGQRYGFVCFTNLKDVTSLIKSLNQIWIGSYKLRFSLANNSYVQNVSHSFSSEQWLVTDMPVDFSKKGTYVEVVKSAGETTDNASGFKSKPICLSVSKDKVPSFVNSVTNCIPLNQVQISLDDNILSIKINLGVKLEEAIMEVENQGIRLKSPKKLNGFSDDIPWKGELCPSSNNSWGYVDFSSRLSEEEIGGGFKMLEVQDVRNMDEVNTLAGKIDEVNALMGNMNEVNALEGPFEGYVETSLFVGPIESGSND